jgi:hypothetical protein
MPSGENQTPAIKPEPDIESVIFLPSTKTGYRKSNLRFYVILRPGEPCTVWIEIIPSNYKIKLKKEKFSF